jgi:hypothetical protein
MPMRNRNEIADFLLGILVALLLNFLVSLLFLLLGFISQGRLIFVITLIPIAQYFYLKPYWQKLRQEGKMAMAKGVTVGGIIFVFIWGACGILAIEWLNYSIKNRTCERVAGIFCRI